MSRRITVRADRLRTGDEIRTAGADESWLEPIKAVTVGAWSYFTVEVRLSSGAELTFHRSQMIKIRRAYS